MRMPYGMVCKTLHLSLASFKRLRDRIRKNIGLINAPGPEKVVPFEPALDKEIHLLDHGVKRSVGTTDLYQRHRFSVSRRELGRMVEGVRRDQETDRRAHLRWIEWLMPGVVWATDFTEYDLGITGKIYLHNTQDLGSRYKFMPMAGAFRLEKRLAGWSSSATKGRSIPSIPKPVI